MAAAAVKKIYRQVQGSSTILPVGFLQGIAWKLRAVLSHVGLALFAEKYPLPLKNAPFFHIFWYKDDQNLSWGSTSGGRRGADVFLPFLPLAESYHNR
jgi:hypothetical protein